MFGLSRNSCGSGRVGHAFDRKGPTDSVTLANFVGGDGTKGPNGIVQATAFEHRRDREPSFLVPGMEMSEIEPRPFDTLGT